MTFVVNLKKALKIINFKPEKRDILGLIDDMLEAEIDEQEFHRLVGLCLRYFESWPSDKALSDDFIWVASAASNDSEKSCIFHPWTIEKYLCATDGYRLHMAPIGDLIVGKIYDKTKKVVLGDLAPDIPDVDLFLKNHWKIGAKFLVTRASFEDQDKIQTKFVKRLFDKKFIKDLFVKSDVEMAVWLPENPLGAAYFESSSGRMAWVMPRDV